MKVFQFIVQMVVLYIRWWHYQQLMHQHFPDMTAVGAIMVALGLALIERFIYKAGYQIGCRIHEHLLRGNHYRVG